MTTDASPDSTRSGNVPRDVTVVIPVYNSEGSIEAVVTAVSDALAAAGKRADFVLVNDGSRDRSWDVIKQIAARNPAVLGVNLIRNFGQHNALLAGVLRASGSVVITVDDDQQHPPAALAPMLEKLDEGFDVVYGTPTNAPHSFTRTILSRMTKLVLARGMGADAASKVSALRAFRTHLRAGFEHYRSPDVNLDVLLTWSTSRFASVPVLFRQREIGASNYTWRTLMRHALTMITGFSTLPLRLASVTGLLFTLLGLVILIGVLATVLLVGREVPGFAFLASIIVIFSGAQLFALGVVGEYLARMHVRLMDRPSFTVAETTRNE